MEKEKITFTINGEPREVMADPSSSLLHMIRFGLKLTGTKEGCHRGECGACTVLLDGLAVNACLVPAGKAEGKAVMTVEGLAQGGEYHLLQRAFVEAGAVQCGFCTPGMLMSAYSLIHSKANLTADDVAQAISGNLCRCTGYAKIVEAVLQASDMLAEKKGGHKDNQLGQGV
jgi:aerobic carbon-monoxide dehydrogenase small subunit